jgi:hypothetical protein
MRCAPVSLRGYVCGRSSSAGFHKSKVLVSSLLACTPGPHSALPNFDLVAGSRGSPVPEGQLYRMPYFVWPAMLSNIKTILLRRPSRSASDPVNHPYKGGPCDFSLGLRSKYPQVTCRRFTSRMWALHERSLLTSHPRDVRNPPVVRSLGVV